MPTSLSKPDRATRTWRPTRGGSWTRGQAYSNPAWPLVMNDDQLRQAVFLLLSEGWMLADSDRDEIVVTSAGQIQTASMQQVLTRRPDNDDPVSQDGAGSGGDASPSDHQTPVAGNRADGPTGVKTATSAETRYERTTVRVTSTSLTDDGVRRQTWRLIRELGTLLDTANAAAGAEMVGFEVQVSAAEGVTEKFVAAAQASSIATVKVEEDL